MPEMDGIEKTRRLGTRPDAVVVLVSLEDPDDIDGLARGCGATPSLRKQDFCPARWPAALWAGLTDREEATRRGGGEHAGHGNARDQAHAEGSSPGPAIELVIIGSLLFWPRLFILGFAIFSSDLLIDAFVGWVVWVAASSCCRGRRSPT